MTRRTYCVQPQRLETDRGYVACLPHQASRYVVVETSSFPAKRGRHPYHIKRNLSVFTGAGANDRAHAECSRLTGHTGANKRRGFWGESLSRLQYDRVINRRK